jgi:hypothetical protein
VAMMIPRRVTVALGVLTGSLIFFALPAVPRETSSPADVRVGSQTPSSITPQTTRSTAELGMEQIKSGLVALVRLNGYKCDTLTKWRPMRFSRGYEVSCDLYYSYEVEDKGGRWVVTVK